jgi:hypothetical protein
VIRKELFDDPSFKARLRITRLESDGNLYQLLVFQVQAGESMVDDISFVKYPEHLHEDSEMSFEEFNTKLKSLFH